MKPFAWLLFAAITFSGCTVVQTTPDPVPIPVPTTAIMETGGCGSCDGGPGGITNTDAMSTWLGKTLDYVLVWGWAGDQSQQEYWAQNRSELWPAKYKILWSVPMIIQGTNFADCYNGKYDSSYKTVATTIAARDSKAIIRMGHEMNGTWYDWSMDGPAGTAAEFGQCYAHVVTVFRSVSKDFKFDWNPGSGVYAGNDPVKAYPGDQFVDIVSLDQYEDSQWHKGTPDERWQHFLDNDGRGLTFWADFAKTHGKQLAFDEWASNYDDGEYITRMAAWMKSSGNVHHQMYWNSDVAFAGSLDTHPVNKAAFKKAFGQ